MFQKILIGTDGSEGALHAARLAAIIVRATGGEIVAFNAFNLAGAIALLPPDATACAETIIEAGQAAQQDILKQTSDLLAKEGVSCRTLAEIGHPVEVSIQIAEKEKADLIILGSQGHSGLQQALLGSVPDGVAKHAPCPVLVARGETNSLGHILVATDGSERSYKALRAAINLAQPLGATIIVLYVLDSSKPFAGFDRTDIESSGYALAVKKAVTVRVQAEFADCRTTCRICQESGHPVERITAFARANNVDMIVVGSHGWGTFHRLLLGSVSDGVLHHAECPVLVVR